MTKYRKKPVVIEAEQYKEGMEDGFTESIDDEYLTVDIQVDSSKFKRGDHVKVTIENITD